MHTIYNSSIFYSFFKMIANDIGNLADYWHIDPNKKMILMGMVCRLYRNRIITFVRNETKNEGKNITLNSVLSTESNP
jgi:hypothetical protein